MHIFHAAAMLGAGRYNINSRRINAAVSEDAGSGFAVLRKSLRIFVPDSTVCLISSLDIIISTLGCK